MARSRFDHPHRRSVCGFSSSEAGVGSRYRLWWSRTAKHWRRRRQNKVHLDPAFGRSLAIGYSRSRQDKFWEDFLDGLHIPFDSPVREHVREFFNRTETDVHLREVFDKVSDGKKFLSLEDFVLVSQSMSGRLHVFMKVKECVPLMEASSEDQEFLTQNFDTIFPPEDPLDCESFVPFIKLVVARRVTRTLMKALGVDSLRIGLQAPLAMRISFDLGNGEPSVVLQTVTPISSANSMGLRLGRIEDGGEDEERL